MTETVLEKLGTTESTTLAQKREEGGKIRIGTLGMFRIAHWCTLVACIVSVLLSERGAAAQGAFYQAPEQEIAGPAGTLIREEPMPFLGGKAFRILYRSTGMHDEPIAVSGVVVVPLGPPPPSGRPIVAWAHPTTGIVPRCAPSLARFVFQQMQGLRDMIDRGYVVAATDYPGLGTPGPGTMPDTGASKRFAVWGHSQGGQAALFTGAIAKSYAPELDLVGVAAAAPASELITLINEDLGSTGGKNIAAMTLWVLGACLRRAHSRRCCARGHADHRSSGTRMPRIDFRS
jgi:Secretory lipase